MDPKKIKENSRQYFDRIADSREIIPEPTLCYHVIIEKLRDLETVDSIADISCGTGEMLKLINDIYQDQVSLYGVDLSAGSIQAAREKLCGHANLLVGDVDDLPLDDQCVDVALNMHSFHHYPDPVHALKEIRRVMKIGGDFFLVENYYHSERRRLRANYRIIKRRHHYGDVRMYSTAQIKKKLAKAGLTLLSTELVTEHSVLFHCRRD